MTEAHRMVFTNSYFAQTSNHAIGRQLDRLFDAKQPLPFLEVILLGALFGKEAIEIDCVWWEPWTEA